MSSTKNSILSIKDFDSQKLLILRNYLDEDFDENKLEQIMKDLKLKYLDSESLNVVLDDFISLKPKLNKVIVEYNKLIRKLRRNKDENEERIEIEKNNKRPYVKLSQEITGYIRIIKNYKKRKIKLRSRFEKEYKEIKPLNDIQNKLLNNMKKKESLDQYEISDIVLVYKQLILENYNINMDAYTCGENVSKVISERCGNQEALDYIKSILNEINIELRIIKDSSIDQESILRIIRSTFSTMAKSYRKNIKNEHYSYSKSSYDIIESLLSSKENYYGVKLLADVPGFAVFDVLMCILEKYINSFKKFIDDKRIYTDDKEYFERTFFNYFNSSNLKLSDEEKNIVLCKIEELKNFINESSIPDDEKENIINSINGKLGIDKENSNNLEDYIKLLKLSKSFENKDDKRIDIPEIDCAIMLDGPSVVCTVSIDLNGDYILNVHTIDKAFYILENSPLDKHLYERQKERDFTNEILMSSFKYETGVRKPSITYQLVITKDKKIKSIKVLSTSVNISNTSQCYEDRNYNKYASLYRTIVGEGPISNEYFLSIIKNYILKYIVSGNVPLVYCIKENIKNINQAKYYNSELWKSSLNSNEIELHQLISIINNSLETYTYTTVPSCNASTNFLSPTSYIDLHNQRILESISRVFSSIEKIKLNNPKNAGLEISLGYYSIQELIRKYSSISEAMIKDLNKEESINKGYMKVAK